MAATAIAPPARSDSLAVYAMLSANAVSLVGNMMSGLAIPWFVLETTGSAAKTGLVGFCTIFPTVVSAFAGGPLVDRIGHRRMSVISDLLSGVTVALIPLLHVTIGLAFWHLLGLVFLGAMLDAPGGTARTALFPEVIERGGMRLERANAAYQGTQRLGQLLGPALAGILIASLGAANVLWVNAATFAFSALAVGAVVPVRMAASRTETRTGYVDEMREGWRFIREDRLLRSLTVMLAVTNLLDEAMFAVVTPVYMKERFDSAEALGVVIAAFGGGAVAGTILYGAFGHRLPRRATYLTAFAVLTLPKVLLLFSPSLTVLIISRVIGGIAAGPLNPLLFTIFQERTPPELRGRAFGTIFAIALCGAPLAVVSAGFLIEIIGLLPLIAYIATIYVIAIMVMFAHPALHQMEATRPTGPSPP